jgi:hypothetical protein
MHGLYKNVGVVHQKMVLAQWVSAALQKALTENNIQAGF